MAAVSPSAGRVFRYAEQPRRNLIQTYGPHATRAEGHLPSLTVGHACIDPGDSLPGRAASDPTDLSSRWCRPPGHSIVSPDPVLGVSQCAGPPLQIQGHPKILFQTREKHLEAPPLHPEPLRTLGQSLRAGGGLPQRSARPPKPVQGTRRKMGVRINDETMTSDVTRHNENYSRMSARHGRGHARKCGRCPGYRSEG
jgi:hypothetical protein